MTMLIKRWDYNEKSDKSTTIYNVNNNKWNDDLRMKSITRS